MHLSVEVAKAAEMSSTSASASPTESASPTTSTPFFTNSPTASSSGGGGGIGGQSTPLYLFTFLATLFVLLFVSSAIVLRSFFLRRRFRRRIEEAIAAGVILPPASPTTPGTFTGRLLARRDFGEKPKLWDADARSAVGDEWEDIKPIAARVPPKPSPLSYTSNQPKKHNLSASQILNSLVPPMSPFRRTPRAIPASKTPNEPSPSLEPPRDPLADVSDIQVSVLVAMPNPNRPRYLYASSPSEYVSVKGKEKSSASSWEGDDDLGGERIVPDVVVGVTEVSLSNGVPPSPTPSSRS